MKQNNNSTDARLRVSFIKQGGNETEGTAIARKGKALLVQYRINDGSPRERWIPGNRIVQVHEGAIDSLPRYKAAACPGQKLEEPFLISDPANQERALALPGATLLEYGKEKRPYVSLHRLPVCDKCGSAHRWAVKHSYVVDPNGTERVILKTGEPATMHRLERLVTGWGSIKLDDVLAE